MDSKDDEDEKQPATEGETPRLTPEQVIASLVPAGQSVGAVFGSGVALIPGGQVKLLHLRPVKLLQAGRSDY